MPLASTLRMAALALFWGSGFLWIKLALTHGLTPAQITVARCVLGTAVLLFLARRAGQRLPRSRTTWGHLAVAALFCNALPFALFALGEQHLDSGIAGVLNATTPSGRSSSGSAWARTGRCVPCGWPDCFWASPVPS